MSSGIPARWSTIPAFRCAVLFTAGILAADAWKPAGPTTELLVGALLCLLGLALFIRRLHPASGIVASALVVALGMLRLSADRQDAPRLPDSALSTPVRVVGEVTGPPTLHRGQIRCLFDTRALIVHDTVVTVRARLLLTVIAARTDTHAVTLRYGMIVACRGEADRPPPSRNPGEFNMRSYYEANGLAGSLFVRGHDGVRILDSSGGSWLMRAVVAPARDAIERNIDSTVGGDEGEFLKGLLIGDRSGIPLKTQQDFAVAGVAHVLAVSGSNVAVVALIFMLAYDLFRFPRRLRLPAISTGILFYMLVTGSQPPVVRATIMALVLLGGQALERRTNGYNLLGVSALLILGFDGRQLFDVGFQLSFVAVLSLIHMVPRANAWIGKIPPASLVRRGGILVLKLAAVTAAATIGTLPLMANSFGAVSLVSVVANLLVVPATGLSVAIGVAGLVLGACARCVGDAFGAVNWIILHATIRSTAFFAGFPFASIGVYGLSLPVTVAYFALSGIGIHWGERRTVKLLVFVALGAVNLAIVLPQGDGIARARGTLRISAIDVGQGDALLVEFPGGETMLIDGGPRNARQDAGEQTVVPYLRRRGVSRIDVVVVTHADGDHVGGVASILKDMDVGLVVDNGDTSSSRAYGRYRSERVRRNLDYRRIETGDILGISEDARVYVLWPPPMDAAGAPTHAQRNPNDGSVVIKLVYGEISMILTGDAPEGIERRLIRRFGTFLHADLLKLGHHGSSTSTSEDFLEAVHPDIALISVGAHNTFHHPSRQVMDRLRLHNVAVARTDADGAVMFDTNGRTLRRVRWREE
jgi:competence protein ComEC